MKKMFFFFMKNERSFSNRCLKNPLFIIILVIHFQRLQANAGPFSSLALFVLTLMKWRFSTWWWMITSDLHQKTK